MSTENSDHYFLKGGGGMGELIRAKDWSKTALGDPEDWPQSLRTMVAVMLDNPFGMYIAWGSEYIQLYNDGYRPILGATKHPQALGISSRETFSEIWHIIESMFDGVMKGKAVGFPDFMLPLNRNGFVEECYFDFSYSPIRKDNGEVGGVLVTVIETTHKKKADEKLKESNERFRNTMKQAPVGITILRGPLYMVEMANDAYLQLVDKKEAEFVGSPLFASLPEVEESVHSLLDNVLNTGVPYHGKEVPVRINRYGKLDVCYFDFLYHPLREDDGKISGVIVTVTEVTEIVKTRKTIEISEMRFRNMVQQAPVAICVFRGADFVIELANEKQLQLFGKTKEQVMNLPAFTAIPEAVGQGFEELLNGVFTTGKPFIAHEIPATLVRNGKSETIFVNFVYEPLYDNDHKIAGVLSAAVEITQQVLARRTIEESEQRFKLAISGSSQIVFSQDINLKHTWIQNSHPDFNEELIIGKRDEDLHLPSSAAILTTIKQEVLNTGTAFNGDIEIEMVGQKIYYTMHIEAIKDIGGNISGIIGTAIDITQRIKSQQQIEESEQRFQAAIQAVQGILWTNNEKGEMEGEQPGWASLTGQTYEEYKGYGWAKAVHPEDAKPTLDAWNKAVQEHSTFTFEHRIKTKDEGWRDFSVRAVPLENADGTLRQWVGVHTDITDNKQAAKVLKANEEKLTIVIEASELGTWEIDLKTNVITGSRRLYEIMGYPQKNSLTLSDTAQRVHPDYIQSREQAFKKAYDTGIFYFTGQITWEDNSIHWIESKGKVFYDEQKNPITILGTTADITEEKQQEQILLESEERLRLATETTDSGTFDYNIKTEELFWSDEMKVLCGYSKDETITTEKAGLIIHPDDLDYIMKATTASRQSSSDGELEIEYRIIRPVDKQTRWVYARSKVSFEEVNQQRQATRITGILLDVTERKKSEFALEESKHQLQQLSSSLEDEVVKRTAELKRSEERFFRIFDSNPVPMSLTEIKTNKIKYANNLFCQSFGYNEEEVIGRTSEELNLVDPEEYKRAIDLIFGYLNENRSLAEVQGLSKEETEELLLKLKKSENMKDFEILYTRKNGEKFPALVSFEVVRIDNESYTVTSYQDITLRKKAEEKLRIQNNQLEKMNKELESFAYISSHDLQEPLRKIQVFATRITEKEENNLSDYGKDLFNRMQTAAKRMQTLIQDLLAYSRTNTTDRKFETTDLNEIIAEVKEDLKEELKEKHATIEAGQLCDVNIIPFQFRQLMHNLIGNSLKFSKQGDPPLIQIKSEIKNGIKLDNEKLLPQNKYCHITVSDNGIGFEQQYNEKIFEVFQRLHGKNEYNGTGIGLSIVKKIVENHHGIIIAKGEPNKGATFEIYIPAI